MTVIEQKPVPLPETICSLITTMTPLGSVIVWFGAPVAVTVDPSTTRFVRVELPAQFAIPAVHPAVAVEAITSAVIVSVRIVTFRLAMTAVDWLVSPEPVVETLMIPVDTSPVMLAEAAELERLPPSLGRGPVSTSVVAMPRTVP